MFESRKVEHCFWSVKFITTVTQLNLSTELLVFVPEKFN